LGPKGAAALIAEYGSVERLLASVDTVKKEGVREKLKAARTQIEQNREMVRLDLDLPLPLPLDDLRIRPQYDQLIPALEKCEFKSLLAEIRAEAAGAAAPPPPVTPARPPNPIQGELF